jgi:uncharacterized membrane protein YphA (DoxX/SURF4 family)
MNETLSIVLQVVIAAGLLNVWLLRAKSKTSYRGGEAESLQGEFHAYGLPDAVFYLVGALKIGSGIALIAGIWYPSAVPVAAGLVTLLMLGAVIMHAKVQDPPMRYLPAIAMLAMSIGLCVGHWPS